VFRRRKLTFEQTSNQAAALSRAWIGDGAYDDDNQAAGVAVGQPEVRHRPG
jgi:hypothetical protein